MVSQRLCGWLMALAASPALAQMDDVSFHGYGGWAVGDSDGNPYLAGSDDGQANWRNLEVVLLVEARPTERLRIVFAPEFEVDEDEEETKIELLYAEWQLNDHLRVQAGRGRLAFGIYADIYDVGTLRPFYYLPQSIYGKTGFVSEYYDGLGLVGRREHGEWAVQWNAYLGGATLDIEEPFEQVLQGDGGEDVAEAELDLLAGGRLVLETPVEGLTVALSGLAAQPETVGDFATAADPSFGDVTSVALAAEWLKGPWSVRGELGHHEETEFDTDAGYLEVAYRVGEHWQVAGRYDTTEASFVDPLPARFAATTHHDELSAGLNYWLGPNFVLKGSYHRVDGNLFAHPRDLSATTPALDERTDLVLFGAQFSF